MWNKLESPSSNCWLVWNGCLITLRRRNLAPPPHRMHQPWENNSVSIASLLPNYRIRCTLALQSYNVEQIGNRQTVQRRLAAARRLGSPNGCREQYVHSNTSVA